jgi:heterodisulfide reductase subunit A-like polyferredoxin
MQSQSGMKSCVIVIGGGLAGLGIHCAGRCGFRVSLFEKSATAGAQRPTFSDLVSTSTANT